MDESGKWTFAPAYDLTYSSTAINEHSTRVSGEGTNPGRKHIIELANEFSINKPEDIIDQVQESIARWPGISKACGVSMDSINRIQAKFVQLKD